MTSGSHFNKAKILANNIVAQELVRKWSPRLVNFVPAHVLGCSKEFGQRLPSNIGLLLRKL